MYLVDVLEPLGGRHFRGTRETILPKKALPNTKARMDLIDCQTPEMHKYFEDDRMFRIGSVNIRTEAQKKLLQL